MPIQQHLKSFLLASVLPLQLAFSGGASAQELDCNDNSSMARHISQMLDVGNAELNEEQRNVLTTQGVNSRAFENIYLGLAEDAARQVVDLTRQEDVGEAYYPYVSQELVCAIHDTARSTLEVDFYVRHFYRMALAKILLDHAQSPDDFQILLDTMPIDEGRNIFGYNDYISEFYLDMVYWLNYRVVNYNSEIPSENLDTVEHFGNFLLGEIRNENPYMRGGAFNLLGSAAEAVPSLIEDITDLIDQEHPASEGLLHALANLMANRILQEPYATRVYETTMDYLNRAAPNENSGAIRIIAGFQSETYPQYADAILLLADIARNSGQFNDAERLAALDSLAFSMQRARYYGDEGLQELYLSMWEELLADQSYVLPYGASNVIGYHLFYTEDHPFATDALNLRAEALGNLAFQRINEMRLYVLRQNEVYSIEQRQDIVSDLILGTQGAVYAQDQDLQDAYLTLWETMIAEDIVFYPLEVSHHFLEIFDTDNLQYASGDLDVRANNLRVLTTTMMYDDIKDYFRQDDVYSEEERLDLAHDITYMTMLTLQLDNSGAYTYYQHLWEEIFADDSIELPRGLEEYFHRAFDPAMRQQRGTGDFLSEETAEIAAQLLDLITDHFDDGVIIENTPQP